MLIHLEAVVAELMHTVSLLVSIFAGDGGGRGGIRGWGGGETQVLWSLRRNPRSHAMGVCTLKKC